jgi:hypothetical protein
MILDKDEHEESIARNALLTVLVSNWLGALTEQPPTVPRVLDFVDEMLNGMLVEDDAWQVQAELSLLTEAFLANLFFYLDETVFEGLIVDRIIPGLLHQHHDVQDSASQLLIFVVKSSAKLAGKLPDIVDIFKKMLIDGEVPSRRIAGAKGLTSIIIGTLLLDSVPDYVVDSFKAISDAHEIDSTVEQVVTQFFSDFWALHDNNLLPHVAEILAPFHAHLRPTYFT